MCHSAAWFPGGFSQPFFRLNCKGFTPLHTQSEPNVPSKHKAAVGLLGPQRCFRHSQDACRGRLKLKHSPPSVLQSWSFKTKQWGSLWADGVGARGGGAAVTPLTESRTSSFSKGFWEAKPMSGVWKKVLWAILEFAWGLSTPRIHKILSSQGCYFVDQISKVLKTEPQE